MYGKYCELKQKKGVTDYEVAKATKISTATLSNWKAGRYTPKQEKMQKIADFFNVSLEYLMTGKEKDGDEKYYLNEETAAMAQEIYENKELRVLFDAARNTKPEDLKIVRDMLLALKKKESPDYDEGC